MTPQNRATTAGFGLVIAVFAAIGVFFGLSAIRDLPAGPGEGLGALADPGTMYDPVRAGEETPQGFRQLLDRDRIAPIYDPAFVSAAASGWPDDALVIGVEFDGEAKAYPVSYLNSREMVIDSVAGIPILVTW